MLVDFLFIHSHYGWHHSEGNWGEFFFLSLFLDVVESPSSVEELEEEGGGRWEILGG